MKKAMRFLAGALSVGIMGVMALVLYLSSTLPDRYYVVQGDSLLVEGPLGIRATGFSQNMPVEVYSRAGNRYNMQLTLPGGPIIKTVSVQVVERDMVIPGGRPFGIKMFTEGVIVVGMSDIDIGGRSANPAKQAGLKTGDIILRIDGQSVQCNEDVGRIVSECAGASLAVTYRRGDIENTVLLKPVSTLDGSFRAGMWVRDSSAGIGTMTYYNPSTKVFVGLGHAVCDVDTGSIMPLASGEAVDVTITGVNRGMSGFPGELKGIFAGGRTLGSLCYNSETGIYGRADQSPIEAEPVPLAVRGEIQVGPAMIYATIEGRQPQAYGIEIERISSGDSNPTKNMVIRVTDRRLLDATGGIVQGMSGSPIIQNGRLVGAVTHVFVNDPSRGYAIFAENMEETARQAQQAGQMAA